MKSFTDLFIRRPVLAIVVNLVIVIAGLQAIRSLNVRQYPRSSRARPITVRTVYVGASADLVRGFITTPLERAIAAADGIDYIESQSVQGLSTINVRLKLNFDAASALADISARVNQVRADLPPEAEIPAINIEPSDAADRVDVPELRLDDPRGQPGHRLSHPRRAAAAVGARRRAEARTSSAGAPSRIRAWLKPDRMAALNVSPAQVRAALGANNYLSAVGQTKGALVQINLTATTDLQSVRGVQKARRPPEGRHAGAARATSPTSCSAPTTTIRTCASPARSAVFMGVWVLPNANSLDVIDRVREEMALIKNELPTGMTGAASPSTRPSTSTAPSTRSSTRSPRRC